MIVYLYDNQQYYIGIKTLTVGDKTPVTKEWIMPANSTTVVMDLEPKEHYRIHWSGTKWEYVEDKNNPPTPPEPEPTPEEEKQKKLDALDAQYQSDKNEINDAYLDAVLRDDTELLDVLKEEIAELDKKYDEEYQKIVEG